MVGDFATLGWERFGHDPALESWARTANGFAEKAMQDAAHAQWWDCEDTWFIGVDALENDESGRLPDGTGLPDGLMSDLNKSYGRYPLHKAQVSVIRPGYPKPRGGESEAAFRYRLKRDAAHVDGLKMQGTERRRAIEEPHAYILGIPLNAAPVEAAPLGLGEGSHVIMRDALEKALQPHPEEVWDQVDVTEVYQAARREVFETCTRVVVHANPGETYLLHRLCLHGVAPWSGPEIGDRRIAYFRPALGSVKEWLALP